MKKIIDTILIVVPILEVFCASGLLPFLAKGKIIGLEIIGKFSEQDKALLFPFFFLCGPTALRTCCWTRWSSSRS